MVLDALLCFRKVSLGSVKTTILRSGLTLVSMGETPKDLDHRLGFDTSPLGVSANLQIRWGDLRRLSSSLSTSLGLQRSRLQAFDYVNQQPGHTGADPRPDCSRRVLRPRGGPVVRRQWLATVHEIGPSPNALSRKSRPSAFPGGNFP